MNDFGENETFSWFNSLNWNLNRIFNISGIFEGKKMADHILGMADQSYYVIIVS